MYVLDADALEIAISGILHQEQEWNGRVVLRPIAYVSKVLSDTVMKYVTPKADWAQDKGSKPECRQLEQENGILREATAEGGWQAWRESWFFVHGQ